MIRAHFKNDIRSADETRLNYPIICERQGASRRWVASPKPAASALPLTQPVKISAKRINSSVRILLTLFVLVGPVGLSTFPSRGLAQDAPEPTEQRLSFEAIPNLPDEIGVAGPIVGVINKSLGLGSKNLRDSMIVAGGANFAKPDDPQLWDLPKKYHTKVWVLDRVENGPDDSFQ